MKRWALEKQNKTKKNLYSWFLTAICSGADEEEKKAHSLGKSETGQVNNNVFLCAVLYFYCMF